MPLQVLSHVTGSANPLFCEIQVFSRKCIMHRSQGINCSTVKMKCRSVYILSCIRVAHYGDRIVRPVSIMVIYNDFCCYVGCRESRPKALFDEECLFRSTHKHARVVTSIERLILNGNSININTFCLHPLNILNEIFCIGIVIFRL